MTIVKRFVALFLILLFLGAAVGCVPVRKIKEKKPIRSRLGLVIPELVLQDIA